MEPPGGENPRGAFVMRRGVVTMLDVLGFRGIWMRHGPAEVVAAMARLAALAERLAADMRPREDVADGVDPNALDFVQPLVLSDTIFFGVTPTAPERMNQGALARELHLNFNDEVMDAEAVRFTAQIVAALQRDALFGEPPLALRGAIALGEFGMLDRFIIGPAVDEVAECEKAAQAALVWLAQSASNLLLPEASTEMISPLVRHDVPLKRACGSLAAGRVSTRAVVPLREQDGPAAVEKFAMRYAETFVTADVRLTEDVAAKRDNTVAFLRSAWEQRPLAALMRGVMDPPPFVPR